MVGCCSSPDTTPWRPGKGPALNMTDGRKPVSANVKFGVLFGDSGVGKTCIATQLSQGKYNPDTPATIGVDFISSKDPNSPIYGLQIWDTAGQERFRSIADSYFRGKSLAIAVYDLTRRETFENLRQWVDKAVELNQGENRPKLTLVVIGARADKIKEKRPRAVSPRQLYGIGLCEFLGRGVDFYTELSSKKGFGFKTFLRALREYASSGDIRHTKSRAMRVLKMFDASAKWTSNMELDLQPESPRLKAADPKPVAIFLPRPTIEPEASIPPQPTTESETSETPEGASQSDALFHRLEAAGLLSPLNQEKDSPGPPESSDPPPVENPLPVVSE